MKVIGTKPEFIQKIHTIIHQIHIKTNQIIKKE